MSTFIDIFVSILIFIVTIGGIKFSKSAWPTLNKNQRAFIIVSVATAAIILMTKIYDVCKENYNEKLRAITGELKGLKSDKVYFKISGSGVGFSSDTTNLIFFRTANLPLIKFKVEDGKLEVDIMVHNERGELIASIQDNTWKIFRTDYEYNNTENAFEVVTPIDRKVLFQINYLKDTVEFAGLLIDQDKTGFYWYACNEQGACASPFQKNIPRVVPDSIKRMFKYPRKDHFRVLDL